MTLTVRVINPEKSGKLAKVQYIDSPAGQEGVTSLAGIVSPGEAADFHVHDSREVVVTEASDAPSDNPDTSTTAAEGIEHAPV